MVSLDLATGARRAVAASAAGWCRRIVIYNLDDGYEVGGRTYHQYVGQYALVPCAARLHVPPPAPAAVPAFVGDIGARSAGLIV